MVLKLLVVFFRLAAASLFLFDKPLKTINTNKEGGGDNGGVNNDLES